MNCSIKILFHYIIVCILLGFISCTDEVGDAEIGVIKGSSTTISDVDVAQNMLLESMYLIHDSRSHKYQYQFNLHIDNYAGYLCVANSLQGRLPSTYFINPNFESGPLTNLLWVTRQVAPVINSSEELGIPELGAIAKIIYNFSASEVVDIHGPIPYFAYKNLQTDPPLKYDKVSVIYKEMIEELKDAQNRLKEIKTNISPEAILRIKKCDRICDGDVNNWILFANSLRLRLAMRMVKVDPILAQKEAESAYADGVLESSNHPNISLDNGGARHPLYTISIDWDDSRLNASLENILKRTGSPLLEKWFSPAEDGLRDKNGNIVIDVDSPEIYLGIRSGTGVHMKENRRDTYLKFSSVNGDSFSNKEIDIFKVSESLFLCAEGRLRGWNTGSSTPKSLYEKAIKRSLRDEGITSNKYLGHRFDDQYDIPYKDLYNSDNNISKGLTSVGVRWNSSYSKEQQLEQIITQKYIANFPLSLESWSEYRRTGYPRLISVIYDAGDNSIPTGEHIRRMTFQVSGSVSIDDVVNSAMPALIEEDSSGFGDDVQGARLWWDVKSKGNF
ncbi:SusD/RagB family nutrient-binding outer membrane lipoprotein [Halosquirtibacter laminarini]|uniref:SusD/RagB family nutrient-binding outer membrane lipoprotein n=1 Tax=Halosquirtibacter laminarini TaxID=3374600 RepID=A0AC61NF47_9BACT|nr:SusD/RagB family nutrient-binding outer membrane lipoprotein [Prolixibacteraceae bacterium]